MRGCLKFFWVVVAIALVAAVCDGDDGDSESEPAASVPTTVAPTTTVAALTIAASPVEKVEEEETTTMVETEEEEASTTTVVPTTTEPPPPIRGSDEFNGLGAVPVVTTTYVPVATTFSTAGDASSSFTVVTTPTVPVVTTTTGVQPTTTTTLLANYTSTLISGNIRLMVNEARFEGAAYKGVPARGRWVVLDVEGLNIGDSYINFNGAPDLKIIKGSATYTATKYQDTDEGRINPGQSFVTELWYDFPDSIGKGDIVTLEFSAGFWSSAAKDTYRLGNHTIVPPPPPPPPTTTTTVDSSYVPSGCVIEEDIFWDIEDSEDWYDGYIPSEEWSEAYIAWNLCLIAQGYDIITTCSWGARETLKDSRIVRYYQEYLGVIADGIWGPKTEQAWVDDCQGLDFDPDDLLKRAIYIEWLRKEYSNDPWIMSKTDEELFALGNILCLTRILGTNFDTITIELLLDYEGGLAPEVAGGLLAASVTTFCPEYQEELEEYLDSITDR